MRYLNLHSNSQSDLNEQIQKVELYSFEKIDSYNHSMVRKYDGEGRTYIEYRVELTIKNKDYEN